jgi:hypothetical protein
MTDVRRRLSVQNAQRNHLATAGARALECAGRAPAATALWLAGQPHTWPRPWAAPREGKAESRSALPPHSTTFAARDGWDKYS